MDFETARKMFYAVKQQDITSKVKNAMSDPKFQKITRNPHVQSTSIALAKNQATESNVLNLLSLKNNNNKLSTSTLNSTQNVEEIAKMFENRSITQSYDSSSQFISNKPKTYSLLSNVSSNFIKPIQINNSHAIKNNLTNRTVVNDDSSFVNPTFSISKLIIN